MPVAEVGTTPTTEAIFGEFQRRLRAFVSRRVRQPADVDDVMQEVFLRIHRHLGAVRRTDRLAAWVFQITRNAIADHYRRGRAREETEDGIVGHDATPDIDAGDSAGGLEEMAACLEPMLEALPASDCQALSLTDLEGRTQREAAARAGATLSGMKSRVQRARRKLRKMLLQCCRIDLDRRGGIVDCEPLGGPCKPCRS